MDFLKAVNIIGRDLEEAMGLLEQLSGVSGSDMAEIELARSRVRSAADLLKLLPALSTAVTTGGRETAIPESRHPADAPKAPETSASILDITGPAAGVSYTEDHNAVESASSVQADVTPSAPIAPAWSESGMSSSNTASASGKDNTLPTEDKPSEANTDSVLSSANDANTDKSGEAPADGVKSQAPESNSEQIRKNSGKSHKKEEASKPILADRFTQGGTLGEKISTVRQDEVISSVIQSKPIEDIASAIGMNDRFYFIRELFSGDASAYSDTIRRLNAAASLGEAMRILDDSTVMGSDPAAQSSFVDVVRRKFSINV